MRRWVTINKDWIYKEEGKKETLLDLPHTWNSSDGQDGGNNYRRGKSFYHKKFISPVYDYDREQVYLQFDGVNASAVVTLNEKRAGRHDGGYSLFRFDITDLLKEENELIVEVDNSANDRIYPQKADFTFYGGIYRDVKLLIVNREHFELDDYGAAGIWVTPVLKGDKGIIRVETFYKSKDCEVRVTITNREGRIEAAGEGSIYECEISNVHKWDGIKDPYLYYASAHLYRGEELLDEVSTRFGVRSFLVDSEKGFFLNGKPYPLRGVSRHQDYKEIGNALGKKQHEQDMALIREIGANTIRLAHYQQDQYFYDLCDEYGLVVWTEIPYISEHLPKGKENTVSQMKELIKQNYNHPSIVCWGLSNEITISTRNKKDMLDNHKMLNELCHKLDPTRLTTLACYAMCPPWHPSAHITDVVSWNLYLGWYLPGLWLNDVWIKMFHKLYPKRCLGFSEYGCEGMPNLHSANPRRGDHSEEYQCVYHEYMLRCFELYPFLWATHVWNMFDFAADARNQGGEPGMNHKGLVTFDRKVKKDCFYLYKAFWSKDPFVYICGRRYKNRTETLTWIKVYSNQPKVKLYLNGQLQEEKAGLKIFIFQVRLAAVNELEAAAGEERDKITLYRVKEPDESYVLKRKSSQSTNWV